MEGDCVSHSNCHSGFCQHGRCVMPAPGDPCRPSHCPPSYLCHPSTEKCVPAGFVPTPFCRQDADCLPQRYCSKRTRVCEPRGTYKSICGPGRPCIDGHECVNSQCEIRCLSDAECGDCVCRDLGISPYKICRVKAGSAFIRTAMPVCGTHRLAHDGPREMAVTLGLLGLLLVTVTVLIIISMRSRAR